VADSYDVEGRGPASVIGRFSNKTDAVEYSLGRGNYGQNAKVKEVVFVIAETFGENDAMKLENKRREVLNKLNEEERKLLGFE